jgi:glycosidase
MEALHALTAIPEIFSGDRGHPHTPDEKPETFAYYTKLFALRKRFPELTHGELLLREVDCDRPDVFTALRQSGENTSLVVINLSEKEQRATVVTSLLSKGKTEMMLMPFSVTACRLNLRGEIVETVPL